MVAIVTTVFVCYFFVAVVTTVTYTGLLQLHQLLHGPYSQTLKPDNALMAIGWDGHNVLSNLLKDSSSKQQMLIQAMRPVKTSRQQSANNANDVNEPNARSTARRTRYKSFSFYSNW